MSTLRDHAVAIRSSMSYALVGPKLPGSSAPLLRAGALARATLDPHEPGQAGPAERRPSRIGGAPLTGVQAVELYRRTQWVLDDVLVARLDLIA